MSEQVPTKDQLPISDEEQWDGYEEDGPMDLEDQLDAAFERADRQKRKS